MMYDETYKGRPSFNLNTEGSKDKEEIPETKENTDAKESGAVPQHVTNKSDQEK